MKPGVSFVYDGRIGGQAEHDVVTTTHQVKLIDGVHAVVQKDVVHVASVLVEVTFDYYAQDAKGNVWYMGERATQYTHGVPSGHAGSWQAGLNGAAGGIIMEAHPRAGDSYLQENFPGQALDAAKVLSTNSSINVPLGTWQGGVLLTKEYSKLEPGQAEHKSYVRNVGLVYAVQAMGSPSEFIALTSIVTSTP